MNPDRPVLSLSDLETFDPHAPAGEHRRFCCPLCGAHKPCDSAHRSLSLESSSGLWRCFRCEASGKLRDNWTEKAPFAPKSRRYSAAKRAFALDSPVTARKPPQIALSELPPTPEAKSAFEVIAGNSSDERRNALHQALQTLRSLPDTRGQSYLRERGLSLEICLAARVKFSPSWMGRPAVVFPLYDDSARLVAAQGRYTDARDNPKARTLGHKSEGVFLTGNFWDMVRSGAPVVVTEAPIDALSLAMCGFPALALCGKSGLPPWLPIKCAFKQVALAFDADPPGDEGAAKIAPVLESLGAKVRRLTPQGAKDWNELLRTQTPEQLGDWLCLHLL